MSVELDVDSQGCCFQLSGSRKDRDKTPWCPSNRDVHGVPLSLSNVRSFNESGSCY
jgi:hypothetical protein